MKKARYLLEAIGLHVILGLFKILPAQSASKLGGWIGRTVGPKLAASRKAKKHLKKILPDLSEEDENTVVTGMWENLGQVMAEYSHLETIAENNVEIIGLEILERLRDDNKPAILFGGHISNWEIASPTFLKHGIEADLVYRAPNNPWADKMLLKLRSLNGTLKTYSKSPQGTRNLVKALKNGRHVGILIDQKYNEGVSAPFFGVPAMTSPAFIQLAQKFKCPLVPVQIERINHTNFRITLHPEITLFEKDGSPKPVLPLIKEAHTYLETWIKHAPSQWIWIHKRWGKNIR